MYSLCKNNAISKVLNILQAFHFRSTVTVYTYTTILRSFEWLAESVVHNWLVQSAMLLHRYYQDVCKDLV